MVPEHDLPMGDSRIETSLSRRRLLGYLGGAAAALSLPRLAAAQAAPSGGPFSLPPLPYDYKALEPHIDEQTMRIHHDKHHAAYVAGLNAAVQDRPDLRGRTVEDLLRHWRDLPADVRTAVRNHGGGHHNHSLFWESMKPGGGGEPSGAAAQRIRSAFGSVLSFKNLMNTAAKERFGSGWSWLTVAPDKTLVVYSTPNQDSPLIIGHTPILGIDVWEHAYYLKYQNRRADYLTAWWNTVNWDAVAARLGAAG